ncbi:ABC transporter substrate-binding protein [Streptomyces sp. SID14478]|uniref:ABC transporter substrate-binding protein n=1 Tax=Streptomyces sp. SID14478 TaxID=2706073 RepID=UPI0013D99B26|nr:ABC transporter substrate-binding protein [Streptomyces sp. SID14478]NEB76357.1 ABC transporter substrate-binding protein [Streptomyces sp. SID14478]
MPRIGTAPRALLTTLLLLPLAACGTSGSEERDKAGAAPGFPYTVTNCGVRTTFDRPPRRAVTLNQHATEVLLALGLQDRMAGTAYLDDHIEPRYTKAYGEVKVLAKEYPSKEELLGADPDFVYGGYASAFDKGEGRDRAGLRKTGVDTRLNIESCTHGGVGIDELKTEITQVARTFGVPERGKKLIAEEDRKLGAVQDRLKGTKPASVFVYDSGDSSAFTAGGAGLGNDLIERAGGRNVFADVDKSFADVSWERVIARRPEVVVIYDYGGTSVAAKKKRLLDDPALADVPAVKNKKFAVLPLSSAVLGVRAADAVDELAGQLHPGTK